MYEFEIQPHAGIGPIRLGAKRKDVRVALTNVGLPLESSDGSIDYFCEASIQVEFSKASTADFIGVARHESLLVTYKGVNVFDRKAKEIFDLIAEHDGSGKHKFDQYEYVFPKQIVTLWDAATQYDPRNRRLVWGQVGVGNEAYLSAIGGAELIQENKKPKTTGDRITALLDDLKARSGAIEVGPPEKVSKLPTFHDGVWKKLSPMLKARFDYAGSLKTGNFVWFSPTEIESLMKQESVRSTHHRLHDTMKRVAFSGELWTLYGTFCGCPIYLNWSDQLKEVAVFFHNASDSQFWFNLESFVNSCLDANSVQDLKGEKQ